VDPDDANLPANARFRMNRRISRQEDAQGHLRTARPVAEKCS